MIATPDFVRTMARYTRWQNRELVDAANTLSQGARDMDRGAFFGSIAGTLNHLLWGDRIWMARFAGTEAPRQPSIAESVREEPDWDSYVAARARKDDAISVWASELTEDDLGSDLTWYSGAAGREVSKPLGLLIVHMFNHGTHHRGQVHAMLTAAGATTRDTDLFLMAEAS